MAPEQMKSTRDVDARADVWSLGAVLFLLITGEPPFAEGTALAVLSFNRSASDSRLTRLTSVARAASSPRVSSRSSPSKASFA